MFNPKGESHTETIGKMLMTRKEWIEVLRKARSLAVKRNLECFTMFDILLDAMNAVPVRHYCFDGDTSEEDEEIEEG